MYWLHGARGTEDLPHAGTGGGGAGSDFLNGIDWLHGGRSTEVFCLNVLASQSSEHRGFLFKCIGFTDLGARRIFV